MSVAIAVVEVVKRTTGALCVVRDGLLQGPAQNDEGLGRSLRWQLPALAVALVAVGAAHAQPAKPLASPLFAAYRDLCLSTAGDPARVLAAAQAAGWRAPAPEDVLPLDLLSMHDGQQRELDAGGAKLHLAVALADDPASLGLKGRAWRVCIVSRQPTDPEAAASLAASAGVPAAGDSEPGSVLYLIADPQGPQHRSVAGLPDAELETLIRSGRIVAEGAKTLGPLSLLLYAAPAE